MLSAALVDQFQRDGFCAVPGFLAAGEIGVLLAGIESVCASATLAHHDAGRLEMEPDQAPEGNRVRRIYEPCTYYPDFRALSECPKLLDSVADLLGENLLFHYSKINMKPSGIGSVVEWHQDLAYYPLTNTDSLAVLLYLDDADRTNGCLQVIPGVHRNGDSEPYQGRLFPRPDHGAGGWIESGGDRGSGGHGNLSTRDDAARFGA